MAYVIKENCWRKDTGDTSYFIKYYEQYVLAQKVRRIHKRLETVQFPHHIPLQKNMDPQTIVQQWLEGRSANYGLFEDRQHTIDCLQALHETKHYINWRTEFLPVQNLVVKWHNRYNRFCQEEQALRVVLGDSYDAIVEIAKEALKKLTPEGSKRETLTILHGDVVHHNVLFSEQGTYLIDFDLAMLGEASDEMVLWMQRALPNVGYELNQLLQEHPYLDIVRPKLDYLRFPNEVMREALYMLKLDGARYAHFELFLQQFIRDYLAHYNRLIAHIESHQ